METLNRCFISLLKMSLVYFLFLPDIVASMSTNTKQERFFLSETPH